MQPLVTGTSWDPERLWPDLNILFFPYTSTFPSPSSSLSLFLFFSLSLFYQSSIFFLVVPGIWVLNSEIGNCSITWAMPPKHWWPMFVILATWLEGWAWEDQIVYETPFSKITRAKWTEGVAQAVEHLLCKCKALSVNPSPTKTKEF
jgi:hypothetical protein